MPQVYNPDGSRIGDSLNPIMSVTSKDPFLDGIYVFSNGSVPGVVAANNFLSLFNPIGSGTSIAWSGCFVSSAIGTGTSTVADPMRGYRITTASAGTLQPDSAVCKFVNTYPNPLAEIRTGNPTCTLDGAIFNTPPAISATVGSTAVHSVGNPGGLGVFLLSEGEGIVLRTDVGDTDMRWNLSVVWGEV
jgi:hypothetical protein